MIFLKRESMRIIFIILIILASAKNVFPVQDEYPPKYQRKLARDEFKSRYQSSSMRINWNERTGTPSNIYRGRISGFKSTTAEEIAEQFFATEKTMLGISDVKKDLRLIRKFEENDETILTYLQLYNGIPVLSSGYLLIIRNGFIEYLSGDFYPDIELKTVPKLDYSQTQKFAAKLYSGINIKKMTDPKLSIYVHNDKNELKYSLVYNVNIISEPCCYEVNIDATSGKIVSEFTSKIGYSFSESTGSGYSIYKTLTAFTNNLSLSGLENQNPLKLENDDFYVEDYDGSIATASNGKFEYVETSKYVAHVMSYYHATKLVSYFSTIGLAASPKYKTRIEPNYTNFGIGGGEFNPNWFGSDDPVIRLGDDWNNGSWGYRNLAFEGLAIAHEATHAVVRGFYPDWTGGSNPFKLSASIEGKAINEALADFFSMSIYYPYGGCVLGKWIQDPSYSGNYLRDLSNFLDYDTDYVNNSDYVHSNSRILSGALWDFSTDYRTDKQIVDHFVRHIFPSFDNDPTFYDVYTLIDQQVTSHGYSGGYYNALDEAFNKHGIYGTAPSHGTIGPTNLRQHNEWDPGENPVIKWDALSGASSYSVYRRQRESEDWYLIEIDDGVFSSGITTTSFADNTFTMLTLGSDYYYQVKAVVSGQLTEPSNTIHIKGAGFEKKAVDVDDTNKEEMPLSFSLSQNFPNPFNPVTQINYTLSRTSHVSIKIYNVLGQEVAHLVNTDMPAGFHSIKWDASRVASGTYIYKIVAGEFTEVKKMVVIK